VNFAAARVALHQSARNRGYKLSREGADPRSLRERGVCCLARSVSVVFVLVVCSILGVRSFRYGPCHPFYSFQGESLGYICSKKMKWGKDEREKQKRWPRVRPSFSLSGGSSFPCSAEMQ
jgi:hypothetical protein